MLELNRDRGVSFVVVTHDPHIAEGMDLALPAMESEAKAGSPR